MGNVNVELLTGFSQRLESEFALQEVAEAVEEEVVVESCRGSTTRFGTAIFMIDSILPSGSVTGIRGPNMTGCAARRLSILS